MLRGWGQGSRPSPAARWTGLVLLLLLREIEYKELQLSLDQVSTSKCQDSWRTALSTSQETRKLTKPKNTKMKTKLRTNPYPPQVTLGELLGLGAAGTRPGVGEGAQDHRPIKECRASDRRAGLPAQKFPCGVWPSPLGMSRALGRDTA